MTALEAYKLYTSLKLHFTSEKYNYFKYNGKTHANFIPQNQLHFYERLSKKYGDDLREFYVANFLENSQIWVAELLSDEAIERYKKYQAKNQSLTYIFKNDILLLLDEYEDLNKIILVEKDFPILLKKTMQEKVQLETLLILNSIVKFFGMWDKKIDDDIIWKSFRMKCIKYFPFIHYDQVKMKGILKNAIKKEV